MLIIINQSLIQNKQNSFTKAYWSQVNKNEEENDKGLIRDDRLVSSCTAKDIYKTSNDKKSSTIRFKYQKDKNNESSSDIKDK